MTSMGISQNMGRVERMMLARLAAWEDELQTNACGLQELAASAIKGIKADLAERYPDRYRA